MFFIELIPSDSRLETFIVAEMEANGIPTIPSGSLCLDGCWERKAFPVEDHGVAVLSTLRGLLTDTASKFIAKALIGIKFREESARSKLS